MHGSAHRDNPSRRAFLAAAGRLTLAAGAVLCPDEGWGLETAPLDARTVSTLIVIARDLYPHDRLDDRIYATAIRDFVRPAAMDAALRALIEQGVAALDRRARERDGDVYAALTAESSRTALLDEPATASLLTKLTGDLRQSIYSDPAVCMSAKPTDGVVNAWGQTHEVANLFVSDGSQFTTSGAENPTLTIVALAMRQADHIAARGRAGALSAPAPISRARIAHAGLHRALAAGAAPTANAGAKDLCCRADNGWKRRAGETGRRGGCATRGRDHFVQRSKGGQV